MSDEIDRIIEKALEPIVSGEWRKAGVAVIRDALKTAGYAIVVDESALLQKGRDAGVALND